MFKDHFTSSAGGYSRYRPHYPEGLFRFLASLCRVRESAWDCATGNGQAAAGLALHFERVIATDASRGQIKNRIPAPNITYVVTSAEDAALRERSMDIATAAQAAHWFDLGRFYSEARRTLRPGGIISIWCYSLLRISPNIDRVVQSLYSEIVGPYWPPERGLVDEHYRSIYFPFDEISAPVLQMEVVWSLDHLAGYLGTWSAVNRFRKAKGFDPVRLVYPELSDAWGDGASPRMVRWPIHMRVGQV